MAVTFRQIFVVLLALACISFFVVMPVSFILSQDVPEEDFQKDVEEGM